MAESDAPGLQPSLWEQTDLLAMVGGDNALTRSDPPPEPAAPHPNVDGADVSPEASAEAPAPEPSEADPPQTEPEASSGPQPVEAMSPPPCSEAEVPPAVPRRLLILDTETTGLDPGQHQCIEVGAILFDVPSRSVLSQLSFLLPCEGNPAEAVNGISAAVSRLDQPVEAALTLFEQLVASAEAVVAHNAAFDRQWFGSGGLPTIDRPWICSMEEIRWPQERRLRVTPSVRDLALAYGVPVWAAHRALTDCIYLAQVFERCSDLELLLLGAIEPRRLYRAVVAYGDRHLAKAAGFRWNQALPGAWSRRLSEREAAQLGFAVVAVESEASQESAA